LEICFIVLKRLHGAKRFDQLSIEFYDTFSDTAKVMKKGNSTKANKAVFSLSILLIREADLPAVWQARPAFDTRA